MLLVLILLVQVACWVGLTHVQEGRAELGVEYIERAIAVRPDYPEARYNLGNALLSLGRPIEALVQLDEAIRLDGRDIPRRRIGRSPQQAIGDEGPTHDWRRSRAVGGHF